MDEKAEWFIEQVKMANKVRAFESDEDLSELLVHVKHFFEKICKRSVSGSFMAYVKVRLGLARDYDELSLAKRDFMWGHMDKNEALRTNKAQMRKLLDDVFKDKTASILFDELWEAWHNKGEHPVPTVNVDIHGQEALFD